jgi:hypothetical protein
MDKIDHKNAADSVSIKMLMAFFLIALFSGWYGSHLSDLAFAVYAALTIMSFLFFVICLALKCKWVTEEKIALWNQPENMKKIVSNLKFTLAFISIFAAFGLTILSFRYAYLLYILLPEQNVEYLLKVVACMSATAAFLEHAKLHMYGTKDNVNCKQKIKIGAAGALICLITLLFI